MAASDSGNQADVAHPTGQLPAGSATRRRLSRKTSNAVYDGDDADVGSGGLLSFLRRCQTVAKARQDAMQPDVIPSDTGVVDDIKKAYELINTDHSTWPAKLKDLAAACICVHNVRSTEFSVIEQVVMLYIAEGTDRIRCHDGEAHMYNNGAHVRFNGLMSQGTLKRVRSFMKLMEGLFKSLPKQAALPETDVALLTQINSVYLSATPNDDPDTTVAESEKAIIAKLNQKAHYGVARKGKGKGKKNSRGDEHHDDDPADDNDVHWTDNLSRNLARLSAQMTRDLLNRTLLPYFIEWCQTKKEASETFCLKDACFRFFRDQSPHLREVKKDPSNNCYMYLNHELLKDIPDRVATRMENFYSQTFWDNDAAYKVQLAMLLLALSGCNVDRAWWSIGPGGVGQSLNSHHIAEIFQEYHAFLDMNMFYDDTEMRKQGDSLVGKRVYCGQENVAGAKKAMRGDLYKKMQSADPVAVRLPYAILTKLVELTGLTRYEMNNLMTFAGVTEGSFDSIMRRSCVAPFKARFTSRRNITTLGGANHCREMGIFERDPSLKECLKTPAAARYTLKVLQVFAEEHSLDQCEQIIEDYVDGLDEGITRKPMRATCGLAPEVTPPTDRTSSSSAAQLEGGRQDIRQAFRVGSHGDAVADAREDFQKDAYHLAEGLLTLGREVGNAGKPQNCWSNDTLGKLKCKGTERGIHIGKLMQQGLLKNYRSVLG